MNTNHKNQRPVLSETDFNMLRGVLRNLAPEHKTKEVKDFADELERVRVVKDKSMKKDVVRLNSFVTVEDTTRGTTMTIQLVRPEDASVVTGKVSVFAPLSIALIGYKEDDRITWTLPTGVKNLRIVKVENAAAPVAAQPAAA